MAPCDNASARASSVFAKAAADVGPPRNREAGARRGRRDAAPLPRRERAEREALVFLWALPLLLLSDAGG